MTDNMKAFLKRVSEDEKLKEKLSALQGQEKDKNALMDAAIGLAKENGFALTPEDFEEEPQTLSLDELKNVAGGGTCICACGGGGEAGKNERVCACVAAGAGEIYNSDKKAWVGRCLCPVIGGGNDYPIDYH